MFDKRVSAQVVDAMSAAAHEENAAGARRLAAIGDLYAVRAPDDDVRRSHWVIDGYAGLIAEVAVALHMSRGRAKPLVRVAVALRERLPQVAKVYASGAIDYRMVSTIVARTELVQDAETMTSLDAELAEQVGRWGTLSEPILRQRIDECVDKGDPAGVRQPEEAGERRHVKVVATRAGMAEVSAKLRATTAAALDATLDALADTVCKRDPRTKTQRRADAFDGLFDGRGLPCQCGQSDCPAVTATIKPGGVAVVIHVMADQSTLTGDPNVPGLLPGFGLVPAEQVANLAAGAKIREVQVPPSEAEPRYRPSAKLAEFVRCRDLTCRFPGCGELAQYCEIDHTVPYPAGPTHPSNLKCLCRFHHILKTFHLEWKDRQLPDGTVVWTTPTGHTHTTTPEGAHYFPALATATGTPEFGEAPAPGPQRGAMMPARQRTRVQDRAARIARERAGNRNRIDEKNAPQQI